MQVSATFEDPTGRFTGQSDLLVKNAIAGFNAWAPYLADSVASLEIRFHLVTGYGNRGGGRLRQRLRQQKSLAGSRRG